jgi:hypothetical protein
VRPQSAEQIAQIIFGILDAPEDVRARMKEALKERDLQKLERPADKKQGVQ